MDGKDTAGPDDPVNEIDECRATEQFQVKATWDVDGSPAMELVHTVAAVTGTPPHRLRPLYEVLDPDALDALFRAVPSSERRSPECAVSLTYENCEVTVRSTGWITVTPPDGEAKGSNVSPRR